MADSERRDIHQIDVATGEIVQTFKSFSEAGQVNNFSRHIVSNILRGTYTKNGNDNQYKGWTFRYVTDNNDNNKNNNNTNKEKEKEEEEEEPSENTNIQNEVEQDEEEEQVQEDQQVTVPMSKRTKHTQQQQPSPNRPLPRNIPILATKGGTIEHTFPSILSASKKTLVPRKQIAAMIRGEITMTQCHGWTFRSIPHHDPSNNIHSNNIAQNDDTDSDNDTNHQNKQPLTTATTPLSLDGSDSRGRGDIPTERPKKSSPTVTDDAERKKHRKKPPTSPASSSIASAMTPPPPNSISNVTSTPNSTSTPRHSKQAIPIEEYNATTNTLIRTHRSLTMAAETSGANRHIITAVLKGKMSDWNGLKWQYSKTVPAMVNHNDKNNNDNNNNDDDDHPDGDNEDENAPHSSTTVTKDSATNKVDPSSIILDPPTDMNEYIVENIVIPKMGILGITAKKVNAPEAVLSLLNLTATECRDPNERNNLQVDSLIGDENSIARICGIKAGDYLFAPKEEDRECMTRDNYDNVVALLQRQVRPITLYAVRSTTMSTEQYTKNSVSTILSTTNDDGTDGPKTSHGSNPNLEKNGTNARPDRNHQDDDNYNDMDTNDDFTTTLQMVNATNKNINVSDDSKSHVQENRSNSHTMFGDESSESLPFCALCNGRKPNRPIHHSWCPKNSHFETSGADEVLAKIRLGLQMNCPGCRGEYESGRRVPDDKHSITCTNGSIKGTKPTLITPKTDSRQELVTTEKIAKLDNTILKGNKQSIKTGLTLKGDMQPIETGIISKGGKQPIKTGIVSKGGKQPIKTGKVETTQHKQNESKVVPKNIVKTAKASEVKNRATSNAAGVKNSKSKVPVSRWSDDESIDESDNGEKLNVTWESCDNVWGYEGHHENDVVIYSTSNTGCHYETLLLDERYEIDPFLSCRQYCKTHSTPEEGYQAIVLERDILGRRPWGFTCSRHEFGGACLVNNVTPLSPAGRGVRYDLIAFRCIPHHF